VAALQPFGTLNRRVIKKRTQARFATNRMAQDYIDHDEGLMVLGQQPLLLVR